MATVVSLTEQKIRDLLGDWENITLSQDEINAIVSQLLISQDSLASEMETLQLQSFPQLVQDVASGNVRLSDLNDNVLPELRAAIDRNGASIEDLLTVTLPVLQADLDSTAQNVLDSPKRYNTPTQPTNPDEDNRDLVVGDTWYDPNDDNRQYIWNGSIWSTLEVDTEALVALVESYLSPQHAIFDAPVSGSIPVSNGPNITPIP